MSTHISLTKIERLPDRPDGDLYTLDNWQPITEGYTIKGTYTVAPKIGERFNVARYERNGVSILGDFSTSPVQSIEYGERVTLITTQNSVYRMEELEELQQTGMGDGPVSYQSGGQDE